MIRTIRPILWSLLFSMPLALAQRNLAGTALIEDALGGLRTAGSVLMIAAHPDDENTAVLAYFARGRHLDTGYLSLTRGEGGQNLIGSEQGDKLGVIRTQELLTARRIDGARQFFSRAIDFGFTKTADETMAKWGREQTLGDIVRVIRQFRPDVIILRFSGTPRDGHGQHQTSAILGREAFSAAADAARFPEAGAPWQARRLMWNAFSFTAEQEKEASAMGGRVEIDSGAYSPVLGYSFGEIAGMSRSQHRSQAMGSPERKGASKQFFVTIAGDAAKGDPFDGIDTTWRRVAGGDRVAEALDRASRDFSPEHPEKSVPALIEARSAALAIKAAWAERKLPEFDEAIALCAGLSAEVAAERATAVPGSPITLSIQAINRGPLAAGIDQVEWAGAASAKPDPIAKPQPLPFNVPATQSASWAVPANEPLSQPYWLRAPHTADTYLIEDQRLAGRAENPPLIEAVIHATVAGSPIVLRRPAVNRYVDRGRGELTRPLVVVPPVAVGMPETALVFSNGAPRNLEVPVRSQAGPSRGTLRLTAAAGWRVEPSSASFELNAGEQSVLRFRVTPPAGEASATIQAVAAVDGREIANGVDVIAYEHIPPQTLFPPARSKAVAVEVKTLAKTVGYIAGAGDEVAQSLSQIGCDVVVLNADDLAKADLSRFDAIVTGVRAFNVRPDLRANRQRLLDYMTNGGTLLVQYNVVEGGFGGGDPRSLDNIGPYPMHFSRDRITVEDAPVEFPNASHPLLAAPNRITARDFEGWVQERGLYFATTWDAHYAPLFSSHDPGEKPLDGGTLVARYGKGAFVFSGYSWFRQLPAGVPGAFRIFANLLSAGKVLGSGN